jgi:Flp pilus assembly pilin Flp
MAAASPQSQPLIRAGRVRALTLTTRPESPPEATEPVRSLWQKIADFVRSEDALSTNEYAVMLALIICLCMGPVQTLGCKVNGAFTNASQSLAS